MADSTIVATTEVVTSTTVNLRLPEAEAKKLVSLLYVSLNWVRERWAENVVDALESAGMGTDIEEDDKMRREVERFIEGTQDAQPDVLVGRFEDDGL